MTTVTIPKSLAKRGDLVVIPLQEYEALLLGKRKIRTFKPTAAQKRALKEARKQLARGEFTALSKLRHALGSSRH